MKTLNNKQLEDKLEVYSQLKPVYHRSADEVWAAVEAHMEQSTEIKLPVYRSLVFRYALAAAVALLLGIGATLTLFHSVTITTQRGELTQVELPDGSQVQLNAISSVHYHPYSWFFQRKVELKGEAFFEVKKGKTFTVATENISTTVLGTSFNVYSRNEIIRVACVTGSVKVASNEHQVVLKPNDKVEWVKDEVPVKSVIDNVKSVNAWADAEFYYEGVTLSRVLDDLRMQYDVTIETEPGLNPDSMLYSGNFKKDKSIENVLNLVGKPFGLKIIKANERVYRLTNAN
jgi:ferric-dicitrate binding protein FerR (iron transport regulator)